MATLELILILLATVLASAVIEQIVPKVSAPLIQILLGLCVELFSAETVTINFGGNFFLVLFVAPLLYNEARSINKTALLQNLKPVMGLAIGLVLVTMFAVGAVVHWLIPAIPFAAACMLGAALAPTDAVAVESLPKDIDLGERRKQILQTESLLNDASGIVGFQFALLAATTGALSIIDIPAQFVVVFFGGLLIGAITGIIANVCERYFRGIGVENTTFHVLFDLFMPFIIYLAAATVNTSGVIAVVVGGLIRSLNNRGVEPVTSRLSIVSDSVWQTISFALNGIVFVLLGTQLPRAMSYMLANPMVGNANLLLWTLVVTAVLLVIRFCWVLVEERAHNRRTPHPEPARSIWHSALLMTIAGPKGTLTLAVIFTIPVLLSPEAFFPERSLIIFLASGVILLTLLLSNFVLPALAKKKDLSEEERLQRERDKQGSMEVLRRVVQGLLALQTDANAAATEQVVEKYNQRIARIKDDAGAANNDDVELQLDAFAWEREFVQAEIAAGAVEPLVGYRYINLVDRRENALLHRSERINVANLYNELKETVRAAWRGFKQRVSPNGAAQRELQRELQAKAYRILISRLKRELGAGNYPAESVSAVLMEYQRALMRVKAAAHPESVSVTTAVAGVAVGAATGVSTETASRRMGDIARLAEVEHLALSLELEAIREAYDAGRLSRPAAKHLRENVTLMQVVLSGGE